MRGRETEMAGWDRTSSPIFSRCKARIWNVKHISDFVLLWRLRFLYCFADKVIIAFQAPGISGGMGRLPTNGIGYYRRNLTLNACDAGKSVFLDIDGAMSYAAVWLNGEFVGGWPYGYASFRLDLTPYLAVGDDNTLVVRVDNALDNSRWYPGAGIYRNVWLVIVEKVHVGQYGVSVTTPAVTAEEATVSFVVEVENMSNSSQDVSVVTEIRVLGSQNVVATLDPVTLSVAAGEKSSVNGSTVVENPLLWGPPPAQTPHLYVATTSIFDSNGTIIDTYDTQFGIRSVKYDANLGLEINGQYVRVQGTNNHHDHGSIGAAWNNRAGERQLELLAEMGCNALRMSHNPPAPELLDLADSKGFLVLDESFDVWNYDKVENDYSLIFPDWHEPDLRSFIRRDRNHPSVIAWSIGNEIPEQRTAEGGVTGAMLLAIQHEEDPTRPVTSAFNSAAPGDPLADVVDFESLNYQGEGRGDSLVSSFPNFHTTYPDKMIWTTESASALSSRGTYIFPVTANNSAILSDGSGGNSSALYCSAYELYGPSWGASPDKVFEMQESHPYVAGEFVWTGFDYIGEPTPYDSDDNDPPIIPPLARSSYFGILDLAGFKKDRFYLYQARWREDFPMAHILPHWNWAGREGEVTPIHVFSSADTAELFVNNISAGALTRKPSDYRFRWDNITYLPGTLHVVTTKNGSFWAADTIRTTGAAAALTITADRTTIAADGYDLSYITIAVVDAEGDVVPDASDSVAFAIEGPGEIVATDNGDPVDQTAFPSLVRRAFNGYVLAIVRSELGVKGEVVVTAHTEGLVGGKVVVTMV